ncbi:hypothetical protein RvY_15601 [Ramazzottius varieornatus]|uniref:Uncharacterized protein n=1 Tax=Ramazzottius varieornatus TaxID=947166 RepID=A0A1D1VWN6_RAMVA|nr:hypothetical protein RvY_15601 [Ramazzottius varieornatus]
MESWEMHHAYNMLVRFVTTKQYTYVFRGRAALPSIEVFFLLGSSTDGTASSETPVRRPGLHLQHRTFCPTIDLPNFVKKEEFEDASRIKS